MKHASRSAGAVRWFTPTRRILGWMTLCGATVRCPSSMVIRLKLFQKRRGWFRRPRETELMGFTRFPEEKIRRQRLRIRPCCANHLVIWNCNCSWGCPVCWIIWKCSECGASYGVQIGNELWEIGRKNAHKAWKQWLSSDKGQDAARVAKLFRSRNPERHLEDKLRTAFKAGCVASNVDQGRPG